MADTLQTKATIKANFQNGDTPTGDQFDDWVTTMLAEGGTGAAYSDESGITVNLMARQFELPREYAGTVTVDTSALTATTGA